MLNEFLEMKEMIKDKAMAGKKALGAWFQRCTAELGDIGIGTFRKLRTSLVDSTMLYGAEVWGAWLSELTISTTSAVESCPFILWSLDSLPPNITAAAAGDLSVVWLARIRCMFFGSRF